MNVYMNVCNNWCSVMTVMNGLSLKGTIIVTSYYLDSCIIRNHYGYFHELSKWKLAMHTCMIVYNYYSKIVRVIVTVIMWTHLPWVYLTVMCQESTFTKDLIDITITIMFFTIIVTVSLYGSCFCCRIVTITR